MPVSALRHFAEDISRAHTILAHAEKLSRATATELSLRSDLFRSAWMFAVGALDAYFCDAYTDVVAASVSSKSRQQSMILPAFVSSIKFPIRAILEQYDNTNWRWRMAAREMMERESVLSLSAVENLFNKFFRADGRFFGGVLHGWITHPEAKARLFGVGSTAYLAMKPKDQEAARRVAKGLFEKRFRELFQRRHDCIHNCDRPRVRPQPMVSGAKVFKVIEDIEFLVRRCDDHIDAEFRQFLADAGCSPATVLAANY